MSVKSLLLTGVAFTTTLMSGCATVPTAPVTVERVETVSATVIAVDVNKRLVSLRGPDGRTATIEVPRDVRNLSQVAIGDTLKVRYYESIGAAVVPKGTSSTLTGVEQDMVGARAAPGTKPAGALASAEMTTVTIQAVDTKTHTVTFLGHDNLVRNVKVKDPKAQQFIATLKKGDEVELSYSEAMAVSVESTK
jgi:hypothetical protein